MSSPFWCLTSLFSSSLRAIDFKIAKTFPQGMGVKSPSYKKVPLKPFCLTRVPFVYGQTRDLITTNIPEFSRGDPLQNIYTFTR